VEALQVLDSRQTPRVSVVGLHPVLVGTNQEVSVRRNNSSHSPQDSSEAVAGWHPVELNNPVAVFSGVVLPLLVAGSAEPRAVALYLAVS